MFKTLCSNFLLVKSLFDFTSIYIILQAYLFSLFEFNKNGLTHSRAIHLP